MIPKKDEACILYVSIHPLLSHVSHSFSSCSYRDSSRNLEPNTFDEAHEVASVS